MTSMLEVTVRPDDGDEFEVSCESRDFLVWERTTKGASLRGFKTNPHMADFYKIAHIAAKRQRLFTGTLADFEQNCELVFPEDDESSEDSDDELGVDPTQPAP